MDGQDELIQDERAMIQEERGVTQGERMVRDEEGEGDRGRVSRERRSQQWKAAAASIADRMYKLNQNVVNIAAGASLASVFVGYCITIASSAFLYYERTSAVQVLGKEYFLTTLHCAAALGALAAGFTADVIGRRTSLGVASAFGVLGAILAAAASSASPSPFLILSQFLSGLAVGFCLVLAPLYITELAPANQRGFLISLLEVGLCFGMALASLCVFLSGDNWRRMLGLAAVPAAALAGAVLLQLPESPRWLAQVGHIRQAVQALVQVEEREEVAALALEEILSSAGHSTDIPLFMLRDNTDPITAPPPPPSYHPQHPSTSLSLHHIPLTSSSHSQYPQQHPHQHHQGDAIKGKHTSLSVLLSRATRVGRRWGSVLRPSEALLTLLVLALGISFYQQATGMDATVQYLPEILALAGISSTSADFAASLALATSRGIAALLSGALVDEFGRKPLLLISAAGTAVALLAQACVLQRLSYGQTLSDDTEESVGSYAAPHHAGAAVFAMITTCNSAAFFSFGLGPITPMLVNESIPLKFRAAISGIASAAGRLTVALLAFSLLPLADATSAGLPFFAFAFLTLVSVWFLVLSVRETRGKSVEEICRPVASPGSSEVQEYELHAQDAGDIWASNMARRSRTSGFESSAPI